ncbi:MAG: clostripain-related cysteine peptidase [Anaerolineae bacterium]|nr:clostripain-related cysteine peptidase [Anaerolineae bacterium]
MKRLPYRLFGVPILLSLLLSSLMAFAPAPAQTQSPAKADEDTWVVLLYQDADDPVLEEDIFTDLNEAETIGSTDKVTIVSLLDRYDGEFDGDGDWTETRRYVLQQDDDLSALNSEYEDMGELDMGDPQTLIDFASWAIETYPASKYALILSDHGAGYSGGWTDPAPEDGSALTVNEIDDALFEIVTDTGIGQFELVGFDACLMAHLEPILGIAPYARYAIASEQTEPAVGWAYANFLSALTEDPSMTGKELATAIVDGYITEDVAFEGNPSRAANLSAGVTLAAFDLSATTELNDAVNALSIALVNSKVSPQAIAAARSYAQSFESIFGDEYPSPFIDLLSFTTILSKQVKDKAVLSAIDDIESAMSKLVLTEKHGSQLPGAQGMVVFFPTSDVADWATNDDYPWNITRFSSASLWDDFLMNYYYGNKFDAKSADPSVIESSAESQTLATLEPQEKVENSQDATEHGKGEITIDPLSLSEESITSEGSVDISTEVNGDNVSYIYVNVLYYDEESDSYLSSDSDYLDAESIVNAGDMVYPDWGASPIAVNYTWEPAIYKLSNGKEADDVFAYFQPETYGEEQNTYRVNGTYQAAGDKTEYSAILRFNSDGEMLDMYLYSEEDSGSLHEVTPAKGDTFTPDEEWLEYKDNPDGEWQTYYGSPIQFGKDGKLEMASYYGYAGKYAISIDVEDMDGNMVREWGEIEVTE